MEEVRDKARVLEVASCAKIHDEIAPYLIALSIEDMTPQAFATHLCILRNVSCGILQDCLPGLLSAYFNALKNMKSASRNKAAATISTAHIAEAMLMVIQDTRHLDTHSQSKIHTFFYYYDAGMEFMNVFLRIKGLFSPSCRTLFLKKLVLLDTPLLDEDYELLNECIRDDTDVLVIPVVKKLVDIGRLVYEEPLVRSLSQIEGAEEVIEMLQDRFLPAICNPVIHLCKIDERSMAIVHKYDLPCAEKYFERYVRENSRVPLTTQVLAQYLHHPNLGSTFFIRTVDVKTINENPVLSYVRTNIANVTVLRNLVAHVYSATTSSLLPDIIEASHGCAQNPPLCVEYLNVVYLLVSKGDLDRSDLKSIFDELVYLDGGLVVRMAVFRIFGDIVRQFSVQDRMIKDAHEKVCDLRDTTKMAMCTSIDEKVSDEDLRSIHTNNANVLAAKMWSELSKCRSDSLLPFVLDLLVLVVESTRSFYSGRMQSSGYLAYLLACYATKHQRRKNEVALFGRFVECVAQHFDLDKKNFESIFHAINGLSDTKDIHKAAMGLIRRDRHHFLFLCVRCKDTGFRARMRSLLLDFEASLPT